MLPEAALLLLVAAFAVPLAYAQREAAGESSGPQPGQQSAPARWRPVEQAMGLSGTVQPGDVFKFTMPRRDLKVVLKGVEIKPPLALTSWVAFKQMGGRAMAMGDLVLAEDEVGPVVDKLQQGGIEINALHNHLMNESPSVMYMHISGEGDPVKMAQTIRAALALTRTPFDKPTGEKTEKLELDTRQLDRIIGHSGKTNNGVYQFSVPRAEKIMAHGMEVPPSMGLAMPLNFQPTGGGKAAITGDLVLTAREVNPAIRALRESGIEVTALHNHMLAEEPRLFFVHFWANDDAAKLARGLRAALDRTGAAKGRAR